MQVNLPVNSWPLARRGENARLVVLVVPAVLAALTLSPAWDSQPVLSLANWIAIVMFAMAAFLLADEDGQRGTGKLFLAAAGCLVLLTYQRIGIRRPTSGCPCGRRRCGSRSA